MRGHRPTRVPTCLRPKPPSRRPPPAATCSSSASTGATSSRSSSRPSAAPSRSTRRAAACSSLGRQARAAHRGGRRRHARTHAGRGDRPPEALRVPRGPRQRAVDQGGVIRPHPEERVTSGIRGTERSICIGTLARVPAIIRCQRSRSMKTTMLLPILAFGLMLTGGAAVHAMPVTALEQAAPAAATQVYHRGRPHRRARITVYPRATTPSRCRTSPTTATTIRRCAASRITIRSRAATCAAARWTWDTGGTRAATSER